MWLVPTWRMAGVLMAHESIQPFPGWSDADCDPSSINTSSWSSVMTISSRPLRGPSGNVAAATSPRSSRFRFSGDRRAQHWMARSPVTKSHSHACGAAANVGSVRAAAINRLHVGPPVCIYNEQKGLSRNLWVTAGSEEGVPRTSGTPCPPQCLVSRPASRHDLGGSRRVIEWRSETDHRKSVRRPDRNVPQNRVVSRPRTITRAGIHSQILLRRRTKRLGEQLDRVYTGVYVVGRVTHEGLSHAP